MAVTSFIIFLLCANTDIRAAFRLQAAPDPPLFSWLPSGTRLDDTKSPR